MLDPLILERSGTVSSSLACSRVSQYPTLIPFWKRLGTPARLAASSAPMIPLRYASPISLRTADKRTFTVEALSFFSNMAARYSIKSARDNGCFRSSHNAKTSSRALA